jgi:hypothetical protein
MTVWVFNGSGIRKPFNFPSAVFTRLELAEEWIRKNSASGILTQYPLDTGVYDWAMARGSFEPKKEHHYAPEFIETLSDASQQHYHYEHGVRASG